MNLYPTTSRSKIRRLAAGRLISVTGGAAAYTALNYTVWNTTHSPGMQALSLLLTFGVAGIVGPFGGALGDRFDRRTVMIVAEAVSTLFFAAMAFAHAPMMLILLAFGSALADVPFFTASRAAIPNLVDTPDDISWANSLVTMGVHAGIAVGPLVGGVLLATIGASWVFGLNAVSFLVSMCLTLTVRGSYPGAARRRPRRAHRLGLGDGVAVARPGDAADDRRVVRLRARDGHGHGGRCGPGRALRGPGRGVRGADRLLGQRLGDRFRVGSIPHARPPNHCGS